MISFGNPVRVVLGESLPERAPQGTPAFGLDDGDSKPLREILNVADAAELHSKFLCLNVTDFIPEYAGRGVSRQTFEGLIYEVRDAFADAVLKQWPQNDQLMVKNIFDDLYPVNARFLYTGSLSSLYAQWGVSEAAKILGQRAAPLLHVQGDEAECCVLKLPQGGVWEFKWVTRPEIRYPRGRGGSKSWSAFNKTKAAIRRYFDI